MGTRLAMRGGSGEHEAPRRLGSMGMEERAGESF